MLGCLSLQKLQGYDPKSEAPSISDVLTRSGGLISLFNMLYPYGQYLVYAIENLQNVRLDFIDFGAQKLARTKRAKMA